MGRLYWHHVLLGVSLWSIGWSDGVAQIVFDDIDPGKPAKRSIDPHQLWIEPMQPPIQPPKPSATKPGFHRRNILPHPTQFQPLTKDNLPPENLIPRRLHVSPLHVETIVQPNIAPRPMMRTIEPGRRLELPPVPARPSHDFDVRMQGSGRPATYFDSSIFLLPNSRPATAPSPTNRTERRGSEDRRRRLGW